MKKKTRVKDGPIHSFYHPDYLARVARSNRERLFGDPSVFEERLQERVAMTLMAAQMESNRIIDHRPNSLRKGDNLAIMREMPDQSVDLVYLDPPFFTQKDWHATNGTLGFTDKWSWDDDRQKEWDEIQELGRSPVLDTDPQLAKAMIALEMLVGEKSDFLAYLTFMAIRIRECRRVMK